MCDCRLVEAKKIQEALGIDNGDFEHHGLTGIVTSVFNYKDTNGESVKLTVMNPYCPFCGEPYRETENKMKNINRQFFGKVMP